MDYTKKQLSVNTYFYNNRGTCRIPAFILGTLLFAVAGTGFGSISQVNRFPSEMRALSKIRFL